MPQETPTAKAPCPVSLIGEERRMAWVVRLDVKPNTDIGSLLEHLEDWLSGTKLIECDPQAQEILIWAPSDKEPITDLVQQALNEFYHLS